MSRLWICSPKLPTRITETAFCFTYYLMLKTTMPSSTSRALAELAGRLFAGHIHVRVQQHDYSRYKSNELRFDVSQDKD